MIDCHSVLVKAACDWFHVKCVLLFSKVSCDPMVHAHSFCQWSLVFMQQRHLHGLLLNANVSLWGLPVSCIEHFVFVAHDTTLRLAFRRSDIVVKAHPHSKKTETTLTEYMNSTFKLAYAIKV